MNTSSRFALPSIGQWAARVALCAGAVAMLTAASAAQPQNYIAYPQDTTAGTWGNNGPLGRNANGVTDEVRAQIVVPEQFLPPMGGTIVGIEVCCTNAVTASYDLLRIRADNLLKTGTGGFPALSATFANNLVPAPVTVFNQTALSITYPQRQWIGLTFSTPFQYRGGDHLVLEFQKVIAAGATGGFSHVTDSDARNPFNLPIMMLSFGPRGSNAHQSLVNTSTGLRHPPRLRVVFQSPPTMVADSWNQWQIGTPFSLTTNVPVGSLVWQILDISNRPLSASAPLIVPPVIGTGWVAPGPATGAVLLGPIGATSQSMTVTIPANQALIGLTTVFQSIVFDAGTGQLTWTNATDATLR